MRSKYSFKMRGTKGTNIVVNGIQSGLSGKLSV